MYSVEALCEGHNINPADTSVVEQQPEDSRKVFGENLACFMKKTGKTQAELAEIVGVSNPTFSDWVHGKKYPRIDKIEKLAQCLGVSKAELIEKREMAEECHKADSRAIFSNNLQQLMVRKGVSRKEVSEAIDVSYYTFTTWCNGTKYPRIESMELLADYFGVSVPELMGEIVPVKTQENHAEEKDNHMQIAIGNRIKNRRKALNMTADELADRIGKDRETVYRYESGSIGNMPIVLLAPLAEALDVSMEYLLSSADMQVEQSGKKQAPDVLDIVVRLHTDEKFLQVIEKMSKLDEEKLRALLLFLKAFGE